MQFIVTAFAFVQLFPALELGRRHRGCGGWQSVEGSCPQFSQFVEGSYPQWLSLRSPELCLVLHVPVILAGPEYKEHKAWPEQSQHVFSAFGVWLAGLGSSVIAIYYNGRGASDDGRKTLCLEKRI